MSEHRYGVHDCPNGFYYLRDVTDHSVYVHRNYGYLYSPYKEDIELVISLLNELADKVDEQQAMIEELKTYNLQHFLEWLVIKGYVTNESMKDINNVIDCVDKFKEYLTGD